jgi:hypothetical protein
MCSKRFFCLCLLLILLSPFCAAQLPSSLCDSVSAPLADCAFMTEDGSSIDGSSIDGSSQNAAAYSASDSAPATTETNNNAVIVVPQSPKPEVFHWRHALTESFTFLVIEQAYVVHDDFRWVVSENGIPFNHYWRDYKQSLSTWWQAGWSAGEDPLYNYVGHPIQGAMTSYIFINNDPKSQKVEFSKTKAYWGSRLKATLWNTVYSTQWSIGPLSEMTVEKYGTKDRPPWNSDGSYPCTTNHCYSGVGKVNLVMTPAGGLGWLVGEDFLDKNIVERVEAHTDNRLLVNTVRCALNPIRSGANILHGTKPWYRMTRDSPHTSFIFDKTTVPNGASPGSQRP